MTGSGGIRVFVFLTAILESMGIGIIGPVVPSLMQKFSSGGLSSVSALYGWWTAIYSIALFLSAPLMGQLADRFGRRPVILAGIAGAIVDYLVAATTHSLWLFLAARAMAGVFAAGGVAVQAVIADVTSPQARARSFAMFGGAFGVGMIVGPPIGGFLGVFGPEGPFWAVAALFGLDLAIGAVALKETLPAHERRALTLKTLNPVRSILGIGRFRIGAMIIVSLLFQFGGTAADSVMVLFTQVRFGWNTGQVGLYFSVLGVCMIISKVALTPFAVSRLGERRTILVGMFSFAVYSLVCGLISQGWQMYVALSVSLLGSVAPPTLTGVISRAAAARDQGELLGSLLSLQVAIGAVAALVGTAVFGYFTGPSALVAMPGATFVLSSAIFAVALLVAFYAKDGAAAPTSTLESRLSG